jgi:O-acetyl-ADP-ribose deacetylase (regulator of RNase III)
MKQLQVILGDITQCKVDAIVNAANTALGDGAGVNGAIQRAAGPGLLKECLTLSGCPTGQAKITKGYQLPAKFVIHAVGPVWHGGNSGEPALLASCYQTSLNLAMQNHVTTIAFPAISCGIFGYPLHLACQIAVSETAKFVKQHDNLAVYFVCFDQTTYDAYTQALSNLNYE